jgi:hypothetical protein
VTENGPASPKPNQVEDGGLAGPVIAELIAKEVEAARASAASVQSRGLAVISSSGTLVILLFGLSALATKAQNFSLPTHTKLPLYLAAVFLVLAALAGIATNLPRKRDAIPPSKLRPLLEADLWSAPAVHAQREVAMSQLTVFESERRSNVKMAYLLIAAIMLEIIGIACVMWAVVTLIAQA